ncbi:MAG: PAS domain S-box protein [Dehalococcoidia bacterium]|nr:PAS domain S-box protein [Dehalococcoidia bacterium]MBF8303998.1 domain S-box protein [Dehalococcoidia bacterium]
MNNVEMIHEKAVKDLETQYKLVMDKSVDGVFIYLDDQHKACNTRLSEMFGYTKEEWEAKSPFLDHFIAEDDQQTVSDSYWKNIKVARTVSSEVIRGVRKDGKQFKAHITQFPLSYKRRLFTIGFVHKVA